MILYVRCVNILSYRVNNKSGGCYKAFELENAARQVTQSSLAASKASGVPIKLFVVLVAIYVVFI